MKDALNYELKRNFLFFPTLLGLGVVIYFFMILGGFYIDVESFTGYIGYFSFISVIVLVFYNFGYNKKRSSLDLYYSLPITHKELFLAKYLFTIIEIVVMILVLLGVTYGLIGLLYAGICFSGDNFIFRDIELMQILYTILIQIIASIGLFNVILLAFNRANNYLDAILYIIIALFIPQIIMLNLICIVAQINGNTELIYYALNFGLYDMIGGWCEYFVCNTSLPFYSFNLTFGLILLIISCLLFIPNYFYTINSYAEKVEMPDTKIFGYKTFVPTLFILLSIYFSLIVDYTPFNLLLLVVVFILQYVSYLIFEKTIKISKYNFIMLVSVLLLGIILIFTINL